MLETLQFGGGIVSIKPLFSDASFEDFGFCHDFILNTEYVEEFRDKYIKGLGDNIIRTKSSEGVLLSASMKGDFVCESITRAKLQSLWFRGSSSSSGTELLQTSYLEPVVSSIKFISVSDFGPVECLKLPKVSLRIDKRPMMGYMWRNLQFSFEVFIEEGYIPTLRVQEEGETLIDFCE